jgi:hypothetical protein
MKQALLLFAFLMALIVSTSYASAQTPGAIGPITPTSSYDLQSFARDEQDALMWQQRFNAAPSGSFDERYAADQRDQSINRAIADLNSPYAFQGLRTPDIEAFANQMDQKYAAAPSGSAIERLYNQARGLAYNAFHNSILGDVQALSYDWRQLHDLALRLDQAYGAAPSGSQKEAAYNDARQLAYRNLPGAVEQELPRYNDFRQLEQLALYFDHLYAQAPSGSLKEGVYRQLETRVFNEASSRAQYQLRQYPQQSLYQIQAEYDQKFNAAPSGSLKESYYRGIRDLTRSLMGYHP